MCGRHLSQAVAPHCQNSFGVKPGWRSLGPGGHLMSLWQGNRAQKKNMKVDETGWFIVSIWLIDISLQWSVFRGMLLKHSKTCARTNRRDVLLSKNRINHPKTSLVEGHDSAEMYCCYFFGLVHTEGANGIRVRLSGSKLATMLEWSAHSPVDLHCFYRL